MTLELKKYESIPVERIKLKEHHCQRVKDPSTYCTQYVIKPEVKAWLDEYAKDQYIWIQRKRDTRGRINFFDKDAALMFKLTWGGK